MNEYIAGSWSDYLIIYTCFAATQTVQRSALKLPPKWEPPEPEAYLLDRTVKPEIHIITLNSIPASEKSHAHRLMLFREGTVVYSANRVKDTNRAHNRVSDEAL